MAGPRVAMIFVRRFCIDEKDYYFGKDAIIGEFPLNASEFVSHCHENMGQYPEFLTPDDQSASCDVHAARSAIPKLQNQKFTSTRSTLKRKPFQGGDDVDLFAHRHDAAEREVLNRPGKTRTGYGHILTARRGTDNRQTSP